MRIFTILGLFLCLLLVNCGGSDPLEDQLKAWREADLNPTAFENVPPSGVGAVSCFAGKVSGVHVTLCDYPDEDAATKAAETGRQSIGSATGLALARKVVLMIAADKDNVDPTGKTLNKLSKVFWGDGD